MVIGLPRDNEDELRHNGIGAEIMSIIHRIGIK